jgi:hypothetical protein
MRVAVCLFALVLAGCAQPKRYTSLCDIPDHYRSSIGSEVTLRAMLVAGNMEYPPMLVDPRCWHSIPADTRDAPEILQKAFNSPGNYNKFASVSGSIELFNRRPWLHIVAARQVRVDPPMSETQERAFFSRMVQEGNAWNAAHARTHSTN